MQTYVPSIIEDLLFSDDSEDTTRGLAAPDAIDDFDRFVDAALADCNSTAHSPKSCTYSLSEQSSFLTAHGRATAREDVCDSGLLVQPPKHTHLASLDDPAFKECSLTKDTTNLPNKHLCKPASKAADEGSLLSPCRSATYFPPKLRARSTPDAMRFARRARRNNAASGRINQVANKAPEH